jgi:hypothetical protein
MGLFPNPLQRDCATYCIASYTRAIIFMFWNFLDKGCNSDVQVFILSITVEICSVTEEELFLNTE